MKILLMFLLSAEAQNSLDLNGFLAKVKARHQGLRSIEISREAADDRQTAGDVGLLPALTFKGLKTEDKKLPNFLGATSAKTEQYSLGLAKKFSTGTQISLSASALGSENEGIANPLMASYAKYSQGSLGVAISQSLWKDFFGHGTRVRREREDYANKTEKGALNLQEKQLLILAEALYWDHLYLKEELEQKEASLARAKKIAEWVKRRAANGIGDRADTLNAEALAVSRHLQLIATQDDWVNNLKKVRDVLELPENEPTPTLQGKINLERNIKDTFRGKKRVVSLEAYLAEMETLTRKAAAEEVEDNFRADLVLAGSYNTNSYEPAGGYRDATANWNKTDYPTSAVSLSWTYLFDTDVKDAAKSSARKEALAAEYRSQRKKRDSDLAWSELLRRNDEMTRKVEAAREMSKLQMARAREEHDKLRKGRSITNNVIFAEQDAAEADIVYIRLMAEQRKLEAQAQLFISPEDM